MHGKIELNVGQRPEGKREREREREKEDFSTKLFVI